MSSGSHPPGKNRTRLGTLVPFLPSMGDVLPLIKGIIVALGVLLASFTTVVSLVFGGGSPALEGAITDEQLAERVLADAQEVCAANAAASICQNDPVQCETPFLKNNLEDAIASGFEAGTLVTLDKWTEDVMSLEDLPSWTIFYLENELTPGIRMAICGNTYEDVATVDTALKGCGCFGSENSYAHLVEDLANKQVIRRTLQGVPHLVEKPEWWRDWLLGGGLAVGGMMVGGVIGAVLWQRTSRK